MRTRCWGLVEVADADPPRPATAIWTAAEPLYPPTVRILAPLVASAACWAAAIKALALLY